MSSIATTKALLEEDLEDGDIDTYLTPQRPFYRRLAEAKLQIWQHGKDALLTVTFVALIVLLWDCINLRLNLSQNCSQRIATPYYHTVIFNGSFSSNAGWRSPPGPDIDTLWKTVAKTGSVAVSFDAIRAMGKIPEDFVRVPLHLRHKYGDGVLAAPEFGHQLHCLNLIRKYTYLDHYKTELLDGSTTPRVLRTHVDHCIDIVRQSLMCSADTGFLTSYWVENRKLPMPDFSTIHKCRNIDAMVQWYDEREITETTLYQAGPSPGEKVWSRVHRP